MEILKTQPDRLRDVDVERYANDGSFGGALGKDETADVEALAKEVAYWRSLHKAHVR